MCYINPHKDKKQWWGERKRKRETRGDREATVVGTKEYGNEQNQHDNKEDENLCPQGIYMLEGVRKTNNEFKK